MALAVPGPRTEDIGPFSGERFRQEVLEPLFNNDTKIEIDINGTTLAFGPSFLSEAFGKMAIAVGKEKFYSIVHFKQDTEKNKRFADLVKKYVDIALSKND